MCLQDVLDYLEDENQDLQNIFIEPPEVSQLTDEDSGDEDGGGFIDNISGKMLITPAEMRVSKNVSINETINQSTNLTPGNYVIP